jgi:CRISPR/Cas system CSM-associated protein Csm3 (group 7 of RAMP superfamily)
MNVNDSKSKNNIIEKIYIKGKIKLSSPTLVACGDNEIADMQCIRDWTGNLIIPATSIAGVIRHYILDPLKKGTDIHSQLIKTWGSSDEDSHQSSFVFYDSLAITDVETTIRDGVELCPTSKTTIDKSKYDYEVILPQAIFSFRMEVNIRESDNAKIIKDTLNYIIIEMQAGNVNLGAKTSRGFGKFFLQDAELLSFNLDCPDDLEKWVDFQWDSDWRDSQRDFHTDLSYFFNPKKKKYDIEFSIPDSLLIRSINPDPAGHDVESLKCQGKAIISGTSWNGAFRHALIKAGYELACRGKMQKCINSLFGYVEKDTKKAKKSRISFNESYITEEISLTTLSNHNKVDRFTGGVVNGALFDEIPVYGGRVNLHVEIDDPKPFEEGLLLLALKELQNGIQTLGGNSNIGRGRLELRSLGFDSQTEKECFQALKYELTRRDDNE